MKTLSREAIQRMTGRGTSGNGGGGGGGSVDLTGYATESWVNENYLSIEFFSSLFKAYDSASTPNEIVPNGGDTTAITNIKAMFGFWTEQYLSALGQNSGGGGGGGSTTLAGLLDVAISNPSNGQSLVYNSTTHKWENSTMQRVTGITAGTGLSGGTITGSGTIAIDSTYQSYISHGETAYGWGNHANAGYWKDGNGNHPTTLLGYGITDAKIESGTITLGSNSITPITTETDPTVPSWAKASTKPSYAFSEITGSVAFSQLPSLYWANVAVSDQSSTSAEPQFANARLRSGTSNYGSYLRFGDGNYAYLQEDTEDHMLFYGDKGVKVSTNGNYGIELNADVTVAGNCYQKKNFLLLNTNNGTSGAASNGLMVEGFAETCGVVRATFGFHAEGTNISWLGSAFPLQIFQDRNDAANRGIQIGECRIIWDATNNALKIIKADGTAVNFLATGGVIALG